MKNLYILKYFIKYFIIVLASLSLFFVVLDVANVSRELPQSANLKILYFYYQFLYASSIMYPISIVFGAIITFTKLIRENILISLYSVGYSNRDILTPIFITSIGIVFIFISLHLSDFSYAKNSADDILNRGTIRNSNNLFFKYDDKDKNGNILAKYYVFFSRLYPLQKSAEDVRLFRIEDRKIVEFIKANITHYEKNRWFVPSARFLHNAKNFELQKEAIHIEDKNGFIILKGFKPAILERLFESEIEFKLTDLIETIELLSIQGFSIEKAKVSLFNIVVYPFFAPLLILIIFRFFPLSSRFANLNLVVFSSIIVSLLFWGMLFAMVKLSFSGTLVAEFAIILPILLIAISSLFSL